MLRSIKDLTGYPIEARDGSLGKAKDYLFDDQFWTLRYLLADTGKWLPGKKVLVSPLHLRQPEIGLPKHSFPVNLTKEQIENCPGLDEDAPVSRRYELEFARYYHHDFYWTGPYAYGATASPVYLDPSRIGAAEELRQEQDEKVEAIEECHLRSAREVMGYHIHASDDEFGHVEDFILDDETWLLQFMVVDSRNWLPGKKFLIDTGWIEDIKWEGKQAKLSISRKQIESAPEFDPHEPVNEDYVSNLYDYYGLPRHEERLPQVPVQPM